MMDQTALSQESQATVNDGAAGAEGLDRVRDILFGGQMRILESRFQNVEERLLQEHRNLRADLGRQFAELAAGFKAEVGSLQERLSLERASRLEELRTLDGALREAIQSLERRHQTLEQASTLADAELRDQLLQQSATLMSQLGQLSERLTSELDRSTRKLDFEKVDRLGLATLLGEMAHRLGTGPINPAHG